MVLRLYQTLKSFLMAQDDREHWVDNFPLVLLGIPALFKLKFDFGLKRWFSRKAVEAILKSAIHQNSVAF